MEIPQGWSVGRSLIEKSGESWRPDRLLVPFFRLVLERAGETKQASVEKRLVKGF